MASKPAFQPPTGSSQVKWALIALGVVVAISLVWFVYGLITGINGVKVDQEQATIVDMLPPPPPPPPPPEEKPPEPEDKPLDTPDPVPQPDKPAPAPMQIDGPAQAGSDAYGMQSGTGGGMGAPVATAPCQGLNCGPKAPAGLDRFWGRNLANALEAHIKNSGRVNVDAFVSEYDIWVTSSGAMAQARLVKTSGNSQLDQAVLALLQSASNLKPPPELIRMPQRVKVGRKRF